MDSDFNPRKKKAFERESFANRLSKEDDTSELDKMRSFSSSLQIPAAAVNSEPLVGILLSECR